MFFKLTSISIFLATMPGAFAQQARQVVEAVVTTTLIYGGGRVTVAMELVFTVAAESPFRFVVDLRIRFSKIVFPVSLT
jgi:hypothetical protein